MLSKYESELIYTGPPEEGGMYVIEKYSIEDLKEQERKLEEKLSELRMEEPPKKRRRKLEYHEWVRRTHDIIHELNDIREKIERYNA